VVAPHDLSNKMSQFGFKPGAHANSYTTTWYKVYDKHTSAMIDAKELPKVCTWGVEKHDSSSDLRERL
jgi:hypothetical protein